MRLYCGIDLHHDNSYLVVLDEQDRMVFRRRVPNDLGTILEILNRYQGELVGVVVESTFNWYWLVDGLQDAGYKVHLANPSAIQQYDGLKFADDRSDARWLAHLLSLGILPEGYIYPREGRALRDLLRKRTRMVQQRTANVLSLQGLIRRNTGRRLSMAQMRSVELEELELQPDLNRTLALDSTRQIIECFDEQIERLEQEIRRQLKPDPLQQLTQTIAGVGKVLGPMIQLETGSIHRFAKAGNYTSYCRCVDSRHLSNTKKKGSGNRKNGNPYLAWAYLEAATCAIRSYSPVRRFYERKKARSHRLVALKAVSGKLARAAYYVMRDQKPFEIERAFGK